MSRYKILRIDHYDPQAIGKRKRRLALWLGIGSSSLIIIYQAAIHILHINYLIVFSTIPFVIGASLYWNSKLKKDIDKIVKIGEIEFTRNCIKKHVGDIFVEYDFGSIREIELSKHIPGITVSDSKSGYFSYILKIVFKNSMSESLIVSDKTTDDKNNLSVIDTMKTLHKIIPVEIKIIT